jgi:hypothetical protein
MPCGDYVGTWDIAYLKITHEGKEEAPVKWIEILENGDAETPWADPDTRWNDEENNFKICAWSKEREVNMNDDGGWDPFPAGIEEDPADPSNHVFVCHGNEATTASDAAAWDNQFWIESPKAWNAGEEFQLSFRYKASKSVTTQTQFHLQNPSNYKHYQAIGDIAFTEEWQTYEGTVAVPEAAAGSWSIAFNLNANDHDAIDFYFDDLSWKKMDLQEGLFVAGANKESGIEYDYDQAIEFVYDEGEAAYFATVGTEGNSDSWVTEVQISTVKGNSKAFKANTLKPTGNINDPDEWGPYTTASNYKIELPAAGVWTIGIDTNEGSINFQQVEGDAPWDPIEFVENPTEIVLNAEPRTSQDWDSQFWIVSNTPLKAGTKTYIKFDYSIEPNDYIDEAKVSTQVHAAPGDYIHYVALGDLNFTTDEQTFETEFEIPSEVKDDKPMQSIAFNMACVQVQIGEDGEGTPIMGGIPVTYKVKNVIWGLANHKESLIDMENTEDDNPNFVLKEGDGWGLHNYGTAPIPPSQSVEGDINGDGEPGIGDLICITNYMTDGDASGYTLEQCDLNKDNEVGIGDVITLTNIMAGSAE